MSPSTTCRCCSVVILWVSLLVATNAFAPVAFRSTPTTRTEQLFMSSQWDDDDEDPESLSFDEAGRVLMEEEEKARAERSGSTVTDEQLAEFEAKKSQYESMREQVRARAADLEIEKSVTTARAIEAANRRALNREESPEPDDNVNAAGTAGGGAAPQVDLSQISGSFDTGSFGIDDAGKSGPEPEDVLSQEEMAEIDKVGQLPIWEQAAAELKATKFPTVGATLRQTGFMFLIFAFTAGYILFLDDAVRTLYTNAGFIPDPSQVFDYSDLDLPDGWSDMMSDSDVSAQ